MSNVPDVMRALVAPRKCQPAEYEVRDVATPRITKPNQVLVRMHAAAMTPGETLKAAGQFTFIIPNKYPLRLGLEGAGVVIATGSDVKTLKAGDEVYGMAVEKPFFRGPDPGFVSQYAVAEEKFFLLKPAHLSFEEASSMLGHVATADQTIRRALQLRGEESLEGKTVYIPAALSATGSVMTQVAKHVFGASKIISTVSTPKMPLVEEYLPGIVDQLIDYKTQRIQDHVPRGSVDYAFNTQFATYDECIPLLNPKTGVLASIASAPSRATAMELFGADRMPWWMGLVLDAVHLWYGWKVRGTNIKWEFVSGSLHIRELTERAGEIVALGKIRPVIRVVDLEDIDAVRAGSEQVRSLKGGVGKMIIKIC